MRLYASDTYLEKLSMPKDFEDLVGQALISQSLNSQQVSASLNWMRPLLSGEHNSHLTVNNYFGVLQAVLFGVGIGVLPSYVTVDFPNLSASFQTKKVRKFLSIWPTQRNSGTQKE